DGVGLGSVVSRSYIDVLGHFGGPEFLPEHVEGDFLTDPVTGDRWDGVLRGPGLGLFLLQLLGAERVGDERPPDRPGAHHRGQTDADGHLPEVLVQAPPGALLTEDHRLAQALPTDGDALQQLAVVVATHRQLRVLACGISASVVWLVCVDARSNVYLPVRSS